MAKTSTEKSKKVPGVKKVPKDKKAHGSDRVVVAVRLSAAENKWVEARAAAMEKEGATFNEATPTHVVRQLVAREADTFGVPPYYAAVLERVIKDQGLSLSKLICQLLTEFALKHQAADGKAEK